MGYGKTEDGVLSQTLREVSIQLVPRTICLSHWDVSSIHNDLCAGGLCKTRRRGVSG